MYVVTVGELTGADLDAGVLERGADLWADTATEHDLDIGAGSRLLLQQLSEGETPRVEPGGPTSSGVRRAALGAPRGTVVQDPADAASADVGDDVGVLPARLVGRFIEPTSTTPREVPVRVKIQVFWCRSPGAT